jgi:hypothetical protein
MRDIRKQYGKKGMEQLAIQGYDVGEKIPIYSPGQLCNKCRKVHNMSKLRKMTLYASRKNVTFQKFTVLVTDETED